jgi:hypothetical protein
MGAKKRGRKARRPWKWMKPLCGKNGGESLRSRRSDDQISYWMEEVYRPNVPKNERKVHPAYRGHDHNYGWRERKLGTHTTIEGKGCVGRLMKGRG